MRISDWSSDVCSSDLISCHKRDAEIDEHRLGDRPEADVDDAAFEAEERRQDREEKPGIDAEEEDLKDRIERDERSDILIVALCELVPPDHHCDASRETDQDQASPIFRLVREEDDRKLDNQQQTRKSIE